jgi:xylan 1,4-beta-xylosidase
MDTAHFECNWLAPAEPLPHFWEHTVGSCHAPLALRADWQAQLRQCHDELGFRHVRFHGLLCDDMSTLTRHREQFRYSFFNADRIFNFLQSIGMRPFVELSFMPEALASGPTTVFHYRGNVTPPRDYRQWADLIGRLARHWAERYGVEEVRRWYFEVWNEPNLKDFWAGTQEQYFGLYHRTVEALKAVDGALRVGGPATAKEEWIGEFLEFCGRHHLPVDFVSTHHYPNDVLWYEDQDTETQLANARRNLLREWTELARRRARGVPLYYTEWGCSSNPRYPRQDEPYAAAFIVKTVMEAAGLVEAYSYWTFSDIFEENYFPSVPFHGGFGLLNIHGVAKPAYRAFELLHHLGTERLPVAGRHPTVDAWVVRRADTATVLLTNHALPRHAISREQVRVRLTAAPEPRAARVERIDHDHANARRAWQEMGELEHLTEPQVSQLHEASRMARQPHPWTYAGQAVELSVTLPPHAVAAVTLDFPAPAAPAPP